MFALQKHYNVTVVAPVSWIQRLKSTPSIPFFRLENNIPVYHPTYWFLPKFFRSTHGLSLYLSIRKLVSTIIERSSIDIIYSSWLFPDGWVSSLIAKKYNLPCFIHAVGTDANRLVPNSYISRLSINAANRASRVISVSNALALKLKNIGCNKNKIYTVYNGLDSSIFYKMNKEHLRVSKGIHQRDKVVLFVGNLLKEKGILDLFESFRSIAQKDKDWKLIIIGGGKCQPELTHLIRRNSLTDQIFLLGRLPLKEIGIWMNIASLLCLPSHSEGLPNVIIEARACGIPVVATNVGGIPELADILGSTLLIPINDTAKLTSAILEVEAYYTEHCEPKALASWDAKAEILRDIFNNF